jgi:hypothetical protein
MAQQRGQLADFRPRPVHQQAVGTAALPQAMLAGGNAGRAQLQHHLLLLALQQQADLPASSVTG